MHLWRKHFHPQIVQYIFNCSRSYRYFEYAKWESRYGLRPLLKNVKVWRSSDIKTHYTLEDTIVTKSEGGSSAIVSTGENKTEKLDIYVSANSHRRDIALITDFPEQLVAALKLEPTDLSDVLDLSHLSPLLQIPITLLKAFMIKRGIIGGDVADDSEDTLVADSANDDPHIQNDGSSDENDDDDDDDDTSTASASSDHSNIIDSVVVESSLASARPMATSTTVRSHVDNRPSLGPTTPEPQSQDFSNVPSDNSPSEQQVIPSLSIGGLYSENNRNRNRERLQSFARNADPISSFGLGRSRSQYGGGGSGGVFDMNALRETLETPEVARVLNPVQVDPSPRRRGGPIPNRNAEEMARDFEVGFLGEQFVSSSNTALPHLSSSEANSC